MTSFDGDGRQPIGPHGTRVDQQAAGSVSGGRPTNVDRGPAVPELDDDPARLAPPADPWLTESATSVIGDARALQDSSSVSGDVPLAATAPMAAAPAYGSEAPQVVGAPFPASAWAGVPQQRRIAHRPILWVLAILSVLVLVVAALLAVQKFGSDDDPKAVTPGTTVLPTRTSGGQARAPIANPSTPAAGGTSVPAVVAGQQPPGAASPGSSVNADGPRVTYEVTASGKGNIGGVQYTDEDGEIVTRNGIPLPWRLTFTDRPGGLPFVLRADRDSGGDTGPLTCTITVDGKVKSSDTAYGKDAMALC